MVAVSNRPALRPALAAQLALHLNLHANPLGHFLHMGDDADLRALSLEIVQRIHGDAQRIGIQAAEASSMNKDSTRT